MNKVPGHEFGVRTASLGVFGEFGVGSKSSSFKIILWGSRRSPVVKCASGGVAPLHAVDASWDGVRCARRVWDAHRRIRAFTRLHMGMAINR